MYTCSLTGIGGNSAHVHVAMQMTGMKGNVVGTVTVY